MALLAIGNGYGALVHTTLLAAVVVIAAVVAVVVVEALGKPEGLCGNPY
jgi:hypothetical protein